MEEALRDIPFPGPEIDLSTEEYARAMLAVLDIPIHKLGNNKSMVEALYIFFTLFQEFRDSPHFNREAEGAKMIEQEGMAFFNQ